MTKGRAPRFEAKDPRFEREESSPTVPPAKASPWRSCVIGCLVVAGVGMLLFALVAYWIWRNVGDLVASGATEAMNQMIDTTGLPPEEKQEMKAEVARVADAYREGKLSGKQLARIVQEVVKSPLLSLFVVSAVEKQYFDRSGLNAEEKADGRVQLQRFVRGVMDKKINQDAIDSVLKHIGTKPPGGNWELREKVTDEELRAALTEAKRVADDAAIPEQPASVDASAELRRIVDEAMKK